MAKRSTFPPDPHPAKPRRKPITKTVRFEVFKRDGFTCLYCGAHPPAVILHVDHIHPVSKGGTSDPDNLATSCEDCNQGKSARLLSAVPQSLAQKAKQLREREAQIAGYRAATDAARVRQNRDIEAVENVFREVFGVTFTAQFKENMRRNFMQDLDVEDLIKHAWMACDRIDESEDAIRYFCGINWRVIRDDGRYRR